MKATFSLGRYAGIPIGAHWSVLLTVVLLADLLATAVLPDAVPGQTTSAYWLTAVITTVLFVASLLAHELAHARLAHRFGVHVKGITLWMLGGSAWFEDDPPTPRADALIAGIGPAVSAALGAVYLVAAVGVDTVLPGGLATAALNWLAVINFLLAVFNVLPAAPLDGGRLVRALLWARYRDRERAADRAGAIGQVLGTVLVGLGVAELLGWGQLSGLWLAFVGWFVYSAAGMERAQANLLAELGATTVGEVASPDPEVAAGWLTVEAFLDHLSDTSTRHRVYPVVDFTGHPVGVVNLRDLLAAEHGGARVADVARPLDNRNQARADEPVVALLRRTVLRPGLDGVLVFRDGQLVAMLTESDLARTLELARLRRRHSRPGSTPAR